MGISPAAVALRRGISSPTPVKSLRRAADLTKRCMPDREALGRFGRIALRIADHALAEEAASPPHRSGRIPAPAYRFLREELGGRCLRAVTGGGGKADEEHLLALGETVEID